MKLQIKKKKKKNEDAQNETLSKFKDCKVYLTLSK